MSSSPALGFAAVVISNQSYSGSAARGLGRRLVDETDHEPGNEPLTEPSRQICQRHLLSDAHRAVVRAGRIRRDDQRDDDAELQAFRQAAPAFVALRIYPRCATHGDENTGEHEREAAGIAAAAID